jgi:hypothetical protein
MKDLHDLEFQRKDWINNIGYAAAIVLGGLAYVDGWGWWSLAVVFVVATIAIGLTKRIERCYDRIRVENSFREDEELLGIGWDIPSNRNAIRGVACPNVTSMRPMRKP